LKGLLAQKVELSVPRSEGSDTTEERQLIDKGMIVAVVMLVIWAIGTFLEWPGWIHGLLTVGVFLLIRAMVQRSGRRSV
jgi:hypothetical protein